jgi:hypothetical protein
MEHAIASVPCFFYCRDLVDEDDDALDVGLALNDVHVTLHSIGLPRRFMAINESSVNSFSPMRQARIGRRNCSIGRPNAFWFRTSSARNPQRSSDRWFRAIT